MAAGSIVLAAFLIIMIAVVYQQTAQQEKYLQTVSEQEEADRIQKAEDEAAALRELLAGYSVYEQLAEGYDVNILIVGDSIGAASGASDSDHRWTILLGEYIQKTYGVTVTLTNISMGGNTSFAGYVSTMTLDDGIDYDLAIICYGQNDDETDFSLYYESIITAIRDKYEGCSIISILESSQQGYTEKMLAIEELCEHYSIPVADTINATLEYYNFYTDDGIHPNDSGQAIYAETIEKIVDKNVTARTPLPDYNIAPLNEGVKVFANCDYISADEFTMVDETTYTVNVSASGILGIDYSYLSGKNVTELYVDGELIVAPTVMFAYDYSQRHILIVSNDCTAESEIKIVFDKASQAEGFYGICFCYE
ncbi:MAG: SGNH/GDSL hydrolase family protein [Oscillospiraceae bacterium]|nr:SGNH/GDSL hydrolase family protein [Oscillospiraceae bacterium]